MRDLTADMELCRKATPGEWLHRRSLYDGTPWSDITYQDGDDDWGIITGEHLTEEDGSFIVAAHAHWLADMEELSALRQRVAELEVAIKPFAKIGGGIPSNWNHESLPLVLEECGKCMRIRTGHVDYPDGFPTIGDFRRANNLLKETP